MHDSLQTLWDLIRQSIAPDPAKSNRPPTPAPEDRRPVRALRVVKKSRPRKATIAPPRLAPQPMQERYEEITREMLQVHGVRVRRWRNSMSGIAWQVHYKDGHIARLIEAPRPKGPMSTAIFLHEIGHHAIGFNVYKPRCLEEYHAWAFAIEQMEALGLNVTDAVRKRMHASLRYAVQKAQRRGIRQLPPELVAYTQPWRPDQ